MKPRLVALALVLGLGAAAFAGQARYDRLYHRAMESFASASYFKPAGTNSDDLVYRLAPLLMCETGKKLERPAGFGRLTISNGTVVVDVTRPAVYFDVGSAVLKGKPHPQFSYLWFYPDKQRIRAQGIRLTLDAQGSPVLWESLQDSSGLKVVYAAHSLEQAAAAVRGPALPGRRYALQPGRKAARKMIVARVIEDGPVPMGPVVYVEAARNDIATVLCRCMPPQVKQLAAEAAYELAPLSVARDLWQTRPASTRRSRKVLLSFAPPNTTGPALKDLALPPEW